MELSIHTSLPNTVHVFSLATCHLYERFHQNHDDERCSSYRISSPLLPRREVFVFIVQLVHHFLIRTVYIVLRYDYVQLAFSAALSYREAANYLEV